MKTGLVMEGGAMRGMFTAGILDVFMEERIKFDGAVGVSAGAVFGINYKSKQRGRAIRYNIRYANDWRYCSIRSLVLTGDMYGAKFCYHTMPKELDIFDFDTFEKNPMEFFVVATDCNTGKPLYHKCTTGKDYDLEWMRASASLPLVSKPVQIGKYTMLDGGLVDPIPIKFMEKRGYDRNVIILTQPEDYVKEDPKNLKFMKIALKKYPKVYEGFVKRAALYNDTTAYIREKEQKGELLVLRPEEKLPINRTENDPKLLREVYKTGRYVAHKRLEEIKDYLKVD